MCHMKIDEYLGNNQMLVSHLLLIYAVSVIFILYGNVVMEIFVLLIIRLCKPKVTALLDQTSKA